LAVETNNSVLSGQKWVGKYSTFSAGGKISPA